VVQFGLLLHDKADPLPAITAAAAEFAILRAAAIVGTGALPRPPLGSLKIECERIYFISSGLGSEKGQAGFRVC